MHLTFQQTGVVGAGAMGRGNAQMAVQAGSTVCIHDTQSSAVESACQSLIDTWSKLQAKGRITAEQQQRHVSRLRQVSVIKDSGGFVTQRVVATIVNIASDICQQGICTPPDLETAVPLGLGYPMGPLAMGDRIGPTNLLEILFNLQTVYGDPRYRPSPWLRRRGALGLSLTHMEA